MAVELSLHKRPAKRAGEMGLFCDQEVFADDFALLPTKQEVWAEIRTTKNMKLLRFLWALATKLAKGGLFEDKDVAMDQLRIAAKFARFSKDHKGRIVIVPQSLSKASGTTLSRLADRMVYIVCQDLLPDMTESKLRAEIEKMISK